MIIKKIIEILNNVIKLIFVLLHQYFLLIKYSSYKCMSNYLLIKGYIYTRGHPP